MMRIVVIGILVLSSHLTAEGQIGVGVRTGVGLTTMTAVKSEPLKVVAKPGASVGLFGEFGLISTEALSVMFVTEVGFEQKGFRYKDADGDWVSFGVDYIQMPLVVKLAIGKKRLRGTLEIGAFAATPINAFARNSYGEKDRGTLKNLTRYDVGAILSGGLEFKLGPGALFTTIRLAQGFVDPYGKKLDGYQVNIAPSISLGYVARFGKGKAVETAQREVTAVQEEIAEVVKTAEAISEAVLEPESQSEQTNAQELKVVSGPGNAQAAAATSDFGALIQLNKRFDAIADPEVDTTTRTVNATEVLNQFIGPDAVVILLKSGVVVDYYSISEFLRYIELNHFKYKITDREVDASGLMSQIRVHRID